MEQKIKINGIWIALETINLHRNLWGEKNWASCLRLYVLKYFISKCDIQVYIKHKIKFELFIHRRMKKFFGKYYI